MQDADDVAAALMMLLRDTLNSLASVSLRLSRGRLLLKEVYKRGYFQCVNCCSAFTAVSVGIVGM